MIIGFTGTRSGMNAHQLLELHDLVSELDVAERNLVGIHGGCIGADAEFHQVCQRFGWNTEVYPGVFAKRPDDMSFRADIEAEVVHEPATHFQRNRKIVDRCDLLIACPYSRDSSKGGTWYTINYARKRDKRNVVIFRDDMAESSGN